MNENETTPTAATTTDQPTPAQGEATVAEPAKPADEATPASDGAAAEAEQGEGPADEADDKKPSSITPEEHAAQEQLGEDLNARLPAA